MTKRRIGTHVYAADPDVPADYKGDRPCHCGAPYRNTIHQLPETTQAARDRDAAVLGEKEDS